MQTHVKFRRLSLQMSSIEIRGSAVLNEWLRLMCRGRAWHQSKALCYEPERSQNAESDQLRHAESMIKQDKCHRTYKGTLRADKELRRLCMTSEASSNNHGQDEQNASTCFILAQQPLFLQPPLFENGAHEKHGEVSNLIYNTVYVPGDLCIPSTARMKQKSVGL